ncbi:VanW family protein [Demequina sp.]|uniref:VanW family protein n=1 Tax=Demequina sp. TaxID=2050685 RepID=UPI003A83A268
MARGRDAGRRAGDEELAKRRNSPAHRSLRKRAQRADAARAASAQGSADALVEPDEGASPEVGTGSAPDVVEERVPTTELQTPMWLSEPSADAPLEDSGDDAVAEPDDDGLPEWARDGAPAYVPVFDPAPRPSEDEDDVNDEDEHLDHDDEGDPRDDSGDHTVARASVLGAAATGTDAVATWDPTDGTADAADGAGVTAAGAAATPGEDAATEPAPASAADQPTEVMPAVVEPVAPVTVTPASSAAAPTSEEQEVPKRRGRTWAVLTLTVVAVGVAYVGAQALLSGSVPRETESLGVQVGGMSAAEAEGALSSHVDDIAAQELTLEAGGQSYVTTAQAAGLGIDVEGTVAQVTGFTLEPQRLWMHVVGGGEVEALTTVDQAALEAALAEASTAMDGDAVDATVALDEGAIEVVPGRPSVEIDQEASADVVAQSWPGTLTVALVAQVEEPSVTDEDAQVFADELETQVLAGPVTLTGDDVETQVAPETVAAYSSVISGPTGLELEIDGEGLAAQLVTDDPALATEGENASVTFDDNHEIVINRGQPGITIDGEVLADVVVQAASSPDRTGELPYTAADPEVSAEDLGLDDFKEIVSEFDTPLTAEPIRTQNLRTAAADVTGTIIQPGEQFNLHEVLSPITAEEGYGDAHVIVDGVLTSGLGGGLSQMATTTYNVGYFAGYELIQHRPHSVWFTRYPAGRESTLWGTTINVVFENNTPYAAIFNSYVSGGRLHVELWSTPHFTVETSASPKTNIKEPGVKEVSAANCEAKSAGQNGFTITNTRTVFLDGEQVDKNVDTWTYKADDAIKCVSDEDDSADE